MIQINNTNNSSKVTAGKLDYFIKQNKLRGKRDLTWPRDRMLHSALFVVLVNPSLGSLLTAAERGRS